MFLDFFQVSRFGIQLLQALATMIVNKLRGGLQLAAVKALQLFGMMGLRKGDVQHVKSCGVLDAETNTLYVWTKFSEVTLPKG